MIKYNLSGTWKTIKYVYTNVSGSWKTIGQIYTNVNGTWKPMWSYQWKTGNWGNCSVSCGGGTQTRSVTCRRNDGQTVADSLCTKYVGAKPATSQACNTHTCIECGYVENSCVWEASILPNGSGGGGGSRHILIIMWDGVVVASGDAHAFGVSNAYDLTSYNAGGYIYTRGSLQIGSGMIGTSRYEVCRQPV